MISIQIKKTSNIPKTATEKSAGYDLIATSDPEIVGELVGELNMKLLKWMVRVLIVINQ